MKRQRCSLPAIVLSFAALNGCTQAVGADEKTSVSGNDPPTATSAPTESSGSLLAPGGVHTKLFKCPATGSDSGWNTATCGLTPDWVLVGGGVSVVVQPGNSFEPGAMLTGSFPVFFPVTAWIGKSKDHIVAFPHRLETFAIGLKLDGVTAEQLRSQLHVTWAEGAPGSTSAAVAQLPSGMVLVGGGALTSFTGAGHLLTTSQPWGTTGWLAASKEHAVADTSGRVTAFAIGLPVCPLHFGGCLINSIVTASTDCDPGYCQIHQNTLASHGGAVTSIGAGVGYSGQGRLLTTLYLGTSNVTPTSSLTLSKDHWWSDSGPMAAHTVILSRMPPPDLL